jgi:hypothetical protein
MSKTNMTSWADHCSSSSEDEEQAIKLVEEKEECNENNNNIVREEDDEEKGITASSKSAEGTPAAYRAFIRHLSPTIQDKELVMELEKLAQDHFRSMIKCTYIKLMRPKAAHQYQQQQSSNNFNYLNGYIHVETSEQVCTNE